MLSQLVYSKQGVSEAFQLLSRAESNRKSAQVNISSIGNEIFLKKYKIKRLLIDEHKLEYEYLYSCDRCGKRLSGIEPLILEHETGLCIPCDKELEKDVEARRRLPKLAQLKLDSML